LGSLKVGYLNANFNRLKFCGIKGRAELVEKSEVAY